jgi:hypothetical protein
VARLARLEVWTGLQCAAGTPLSVVADLLTAVSTTPHQDVASLEITLPRASAAAPDIRERRVLRTIDVDDAVAEWVITAIAERQSPAGAVMTVQALAPEVLLGSACVVTQAQADGTVVPDFESLGLTPTAHLAAAIVPALAGAGLSWVAIGTISSEARLDLTYAWDSPLVLIKRLAELTSLEWRFRRDGSTQYVIDLIDRVGSTDVTLDARLGRNLLGVTRDRSSTEQVTRVYPRGVDMGDGIRATMARNRWEITDITGTTVTLADPAENEGPVQIYGQLNGFYLRLAPDGTPTLITASDDDTQEVVVASVSGLAEGDLVEICATSTGGDLLYLQSPDDVLTYGTIAGVVDRPDMTETVNLISNPLTR